MRPAIYVVLICVAAVITPGSLHAVEYCNTGDTFSISNAKIRKIEQTNLGWSIRVKLPYNDQCNIDGVDIGGKKRPPEECRVGGTLTATGTVDLDHYTVLEVASVECKVGELYEVFRSKTGVFSQRYEKATWLRDGDKEDSLYLKHTSDRFLLASIEPAEGGSSLKTLRSGVVSQYSGSSNVFSVLEEKTVTINGNELLAI